ncbi:hypothetical protein [Alkalicoccus urumqiensis]|nr:hypothetical protein [Alkalicoccus urumqiensis]
MDLIVFLIVYTIVILVISQIFVGKQIRALEQRIEKKIARDKDTEDEE